MTELSPERTLSNGNKASAVVGDDGSSVVEPLLAAGAVGQSFSKRITATVNTTLTITPPAGTWRYLKVSNMTADTWVSVGINESPVAAPSADPGVAADWEVGYDVIGGQSELIPLSGTVTTIRLLSSASASVVLNVIA